VTQLLSRSTLLAKVMTKHHFRASTTLRVATVGLLAAVIGLSTSLSGHTEPLRPLHSGEKVYLLRGFTNVLSPGIDELAEELRSRNVSMTVANHAFAAPLASEALQDCQSGRITSIVLVGHSFGASAALSMAETLREAGLQVALIVTFDPVTRNSVPPMFIGWKTSISRTGREYSMPSDLKVVA
jgi:hypothetical protein